MNRPLALTSKVQEATQSAMALKNAITSAVNVNTGQLNLNKFQAELKASGMTLQDYAMKLKSLGPQGAQAFSQLAMAINSADTRLLSLGRTLKPLTDQLFSAMKWSIAYGAINTFTKSISSAVSYAKELNDALTDIRVVTGYSEKTMANFVKTAESAAKILSTTAAEYSKASLIYFQQGLSTEEVMERTKTTIKLANVLGESAETVSDWMTAIWNNFDNGSQSLEYYADVLAKLGAATASSADEIAGGLEKFAAVAETVGLSYEYAASALATITAETRQSEEVVGTALKTIFSRMEGLSLGETLDDGTTLTKYSAALAAVGINIKDANGQLREMDDILDDTGARWATLTKDQQVALAQSVAGVRQYTQFIALMDNWDVMQNNVKMAKDSGGALAQQYAIYADSVEGSQKRMQESFNQLKKSFWQEDDSKKLYDSLAKIGEIATDLMESFGGLETILLAAATALMKMYQPNIVSFINQATVGVVNLGNGIKNSFAGKAFNPFADFQASATQMSKQLISETANPNANQDTSELLNKRLDISSLLVQKSKDMTVSQREQYEIEAKGLEQATLSLQREQEKLAVLKEQNNEKNSEISSKVAGIAETQGVAAFRGESMAATVQDASSYNLSMDQRQEVAGMLNQDVSRIEQQIKQANIPIKTMKENFEEVRKAIDEFTTEGQSDINKLKEAVENFNKAVGENLEEKFEKAVGEDAVDMTPEEGQPLAKPEIPKNMDKISDSNLLSTRISEVTSSESFTNLTEDSQNQIQSYQAQADALAKEKKALMESNEALSKRKKALSSLLQSEKLDEKTKTKKTRQLKSLDAVIKSNNKKLDKNKQATKNLSKETNKYLKTNTKTKKSVDKNSKAYKENTDAIKKGASGYRDLAAAEEATGKTTETLGQKFDKLKAKISSAGSDGITKFVSGLSSLSQYAMGVNMLTSSFSSLSDSIKEGNVSFSDIMSSVSSFSMGMLSLLPVCGKVFNFVKQGIMKNRAEWAVAHQEKLSQDQKEIVSAYLTAKKEMQAAKESGNAQQIENAKVQLSNAMAAVSGVGKQIGMGPVGWATAAATIAMLVPIFGSIFPNVGKSKAEKQEEEKEELSESIDKTQTEISKINEVQDAASGVSELTDEYIRLKNAGESTADTIKSMKDQIPGLIEQYKELADTLKDPDLQRLVLRYEMEYEEFLKTGDATGLQEAQDNLDTEIAEKELSKNKQVATDSTRSALLSSGSGNNRNKGRAVDGKLELRLGGSGQDDIKEIVKKYVPSATWSNNGRVVKFKMGTPAEALQTYEELGAALAEMDKQGLSGKKAYERLAEQYGEMGENIETLEVAQAEVVKYATEDFAQGDSNKASQVNAKLKNQGIDLNNLTLENFEENRDKIITALCEVYGVTEEEAETMMQGHPVLRGLEFGITLFAEDGDIGVQLAGKSEAFKKEVEAWYSELSAEEQVLARGIDYTLVNNTEDLDKALEERKELSAEMEIDAQLEEIELSEKAFDSYTESIVKNTEALKDDTIAAKKYTLSIIKAGKALGSLVERQDELFKKLAKGETSFGYYEALGDMANELSTVAGFEVSIDTVEQLYKSGDLKGILDGNTDSLNRFLTLANSDLMANAKKNISELTPSEDDEDGWAEYYVQSDYYFSLIQQDLADGQIDNMAAYQDFLDFCVTKGIMSHDQIRQYFANNDIVLKAHVDFTADGVGIFGADDWIQLDKGSRANSLIESMKEFSDSEGEEREEKKLEDEVERYENITSAIEAQERALDKLSKAKDRAYGANRIALMDQEIKATERLLELEKEKLRQMEENYKLDYSYAKGLGLEVDENGTILNAEEVRTALVEKYNSGEISEEEYNESVERLDRFIETNSEYFDQLANIEDKTYELKDLALEKITYKVEFELELDDAEMEYLDYMFENLDDDIYGIAESFDIIGQKVENTFSKIETTTNGIKDILSLAGASEEQIAAFMAGDTSALEGLNLEEADIQQLMTWRSDLLSYNQELIDYKNQISEQFTEALGKASEAMEKSSNKLEHYNSVLTTYKDIIELAGKKTLGFTNDMMQSLSDVTVQNAINQTKVARATYEMNKEAAESAKQLYEQGAITEEAYLEAIENERTAYEDMLSMVNDGVQLATDNFVSAMERVAESFSEAMGGMAGSLEDLQRQFEQQEDLSSLYVEDYTKVYNLSKLTRNINKSINATDNVRAKGKLRELEEEILAIQESGKEMSQYELDNLQKKYDLRLAEIALEEAQNAKSQVRMQRDSEGNWNYVYTADTSAIDQAQQKYEDSLYNIQNSNAAYIKEMQNNIVSTEQAMYDALASLAEETDLTDEEFEKRKKEIQDYYLAKMDYYTRQLKIVLENNNYLYNTDWQNYSTATGYKISANEDFIDSFEETTYAQLTGFNSLDQVYNSFAENTEIALQETTKNFQDYKNNVKIVFESAGMDVTEFSESFQKEMNEIQKSSDETAENSEEMKDDMIDAFDQITNSVSTFNTNYGEQIDGVIQKNLDLITSLDDVLKKIGEVNNAEVNPSTSPSNGVQPENIETSNTGNNDYVDQDAGDDAGRVVQYNTYNDKNDTANIKDLNKEINVDTLSNKKLNWNGLDKNYTFTYTKMGSNEEITEYVDATSAERLGQAGVPGYGVAQYTTLMNGQKVTAYLGYNDLLKYKAVKYINPSGTVSYYLVPKDENFSSSNVGKYKSITEVTYSSSLVSYIPKTTVDDSKSNKQNTVSPLYVKYVGPYGGGTKDGIEYSLATYYYKDGKMKQYSTGKRNTKYTTGKTYKITQLYKYNGAVYGRIGSKDWTLNGDELITQWIPLTGANKMPDFTIQDTNNEKYQEILKAADGTTVGFDTGGYTGEWDSSGRIAMLHQKEIVLNAHDTENFLSAINILRDIVAVIDLKAISQSMNLSNNISSSTVSPFAQTLEQEVTIHAEFPNATNRTEIEEAFDSLLNRASQYANRKY